MNRDFDQDNGILRAVPGQSLSAGIKELPPPGPGQQQSTMMVEVDGEHLGRVRVTYELNCHTLRKKSHYFWTPTHAELVAP